MGAVVGDSGVVLNLEGIRVAGQGRGRGPGVGCASLAGGKDRNGLQVGGSAILQGDGDVPTGVRPGQGEGLAGNDIDCRSGQHFISSLVNNAASNDVWTPANFPQTSIAGCTQCPHCK